ncbi:MAG: LysR substrate-binding domain-containing protein [Polyangiales bacterium]
MRAAFTLRQLEYAVALAERLNFTRAARQCHATQSALSAGIKELERALGATLFERDKTSVTITPAGVELVARARGVLAACDDLADEAARVGAPMRGLLRLGVIPTVAPFVLPSLLPKLRRAHPELTLALREDLTVHLLARLRAGELDAALIALPYDTAGLLVRPLYGDALVIVGRADDASLRASKVAVTAPLEGRLLLLEEGHCLRAHALAACGAAERAARERASGFEATSLLTLVEMVSFGLGVALLPEMAVARGLLKGTGLTARPLVRGPSRTIALVSRASTARRPELDALATLLCAQRPTRAVTTGA